MSEDKANPFVPELDLFTKPDGLTQAQYIREALVRRLSMAVTDAYMKYTAAVNQYQELMRLIEAYKQDDES